jgi:hypothetical protein
MFKPPIAIWLRPVLALVALMGVLSLTACGGGGGTVNGGSTNPPPSVVTVFPPTQTIYPGSAATFTISGGVPPYQVFSSNSSVLPLAQTVPSNQVLLFANPVSSSVSVTATVQDSIGQTAPTTILVAPALLFPSGLVITASDSTCGAAALCTGQTGTVKVTATGIAGAALAGRQIRFDVVYGAFAILSTNPGTPQVQTLTVSTDVSGVATVGIQALVNVSTQPAQIRATDLTSGQALIGNFTIVRNQDGSSFITVIPSTATITGPDSAHCPNGVSVDYRIYGGTPPYRVTASFPQAVEIENEPVPASGDAFTAVTNGNFCVNPLTFSILDAAGLQTTATLITTVGTGTPPSTLVVSPATYDDGLSCLGKTYSIAISGGNPSYTITTVTKPANGLTPNFPSPISSSGVVAITGLGFTNSTSSGAYTFRVNSSDGQSSQVVITCAVN